MNCLPLVTQKMQQGIHVICNSSTMESTVVPESPANRILQEEEPPASNNTVPINTQQQLNTNLLRCFNNWVSVIIREENRATLLRKFLPLSLKTKWQLQLENPFSLDRKNLSASSLFMSAVFKRYDISSHYNLAVFISTPSHQTSKYAVMPLTLTSSSFLQTVVRLKNAFSFTSTFLYSKVEKWCFHMTLLFYLYLLMVFALLVSFSYIIKNLKQ